MLEELLTLGHKGAEYDAWLCKISEGDQFSSGFVDANPNSKIPTLIDTQTNPRNEFLNQVLYFYTWLKNLMNFYQKLFQKNGMSFLVILANGWYTLSWRRLWSFLQICT